jgi:glyoxylase-like metal-dependent hydrolase (beta-lactamase superfamily II)
MAYTVDILFFGFPAMLGLASCALIRDEKHNILFDTGNGYMFHQMERLFAERNMAFGDIDMVVLSHLHWDHTFNYSFFPRAKFVLSLAEWEHANNLREPDIFVDEAILPFLRTADVHFVVRDGEEILPGMEILLTPGHTPGSISLLLEKDGENLVFTGDAVKTRGELRTCAAGMSHDSPVTRATVEKILKIADRVLPGHDSWLFIKNGEVISTPNELILNFTQGVTVNGGQGHIGISLD